MSETSDERKTPEVGIRDEDLPEDLQPTDDNPLAQTPEQQDEAKKDQEPAKVEGMPDLGNPGSA